MLKQEMKNRESIYLDSGRVLKSLDDKKGSLKAIVFSLPLSLSNKKAIYALTFKTLENKSLINEVISSYKLLEKEPKLLYHTALVMVYDLLLGSSFKTRGPMTRSVLRHKNELVKIYQTKKSNSKSISSNDESSKHVGLPRYVRINTLKTTSASDVIDEIKKLGFREGADITEVEANQMMFTCDRLIPNLLVFGSSPKELRQLTDSNLYKTHRIILQDKSSCLPVHVLAPPPGSSVIDCCAAPGNKTSQAAALMENKGTVFSYDRDKVRHNAMKKMLASLGVECVKTFNEDFLKVRPDCYDDVQYIMVDPSCSGSGMMRRAEANHNSVGDQKRLQSLSRFQAMILKHALSFPSVKRVVYSTCSIHKEENEDVVLEALTEYSAIYELVHVLPEWKTRGVTSSTIGSLCVRVSPMADRAQGFFLALFERKS